MDIYKTHSNTRRIKKSYLFFLQFSRCIWWCHKVVDNSKTSGSRRNCWWRRGRVKQNCLWFTYCDDNSYLLIANKVVFLPHFQVQSTISIQSSNLLPSVARVLAAALIWNCTRDLKIREKNTFLQSIPTFTHFLSVSHLF